MATAKVKDRRMYRLFSIVALVVGGALLIGGLLLSKPGVAITGGLIALVHGVTAQIVLAAEARAAASREV